MAYYYPDLNISGMETVSILGGCGHEAVEVRDLLEVFPELASEGETNSEFARKVEQAADLARREDAYVDLRSRLDVDYEDKLDAVAEALDRFEEKEESN